MAGPSQTADRRAGHSVVRLPRYWYVACLSSELGRRPLGRVVLDTPMVLFRAGCVPERRAGCVPERRAGCVLGPPAALLDCCPHRNVPLSMGRVQGDLLECRYHGWRFDGEGSCRAVPGLLGGSADRVARRVTSFPVEERDGFVWVFPDTDPDSDTDGDTDERPGTGPPSLPHVGSPGYVTVHRSMRVAATLHAALENTLDVPHTAFLHRGFFRGGREPVEVDVVVRDGPGQVEAEYMGEPRPPGVIGRLLAPGGGVVSHVDRFLLPSLAQVEYRLGRHHLVVTTAFTPVSDVDTRMHAAVTFRGALPASLVRAVVTPIANRIFAQDATILRRQSDNVERFGAEHFASTELDVLGNHIWRLLCQAERGETPTSDVTEHRITMRI